MRARSLTSGLQWFQTYWTFSIKIKNTGNLPITNVNCTLADKYKATFGYAIPFPTVVFGGNLTGSWGSSGSLFKGGVAYPVAIQLKYIDGSTSAILATVTALNT